MCIRDSPISLAVIVLSKRKLHKQNRTNYLNKREVTEQIQEGLDTIQEIKSYHQEAAYLNGLDEKIDKYEHQLTRSELLMGIAVNGSQSILKLGLASVIIVGASLVADVYKRQGLNKSRSMATVRLVSSNTSSGSLLAFCALIKASSHLLTNTLSSESSSATRFPSATVLTITPKFLGLML